MSTEDNTINYFPDDDLLTISTSPSENMEIDENLPSDSNINLASDNNNVTKDLENVVCENSNQSKSLDMPSLKTEELDYEPEGSKNDTINNSENNQNLANINLFNLQPIVTVDNIESTSSKNLEKPKLKSIIKSTTVDNRKRVSFDKYPSYRTQTYSNKNWKKYLISKSFSDHNSDSKKTQKPITKLVSKEIESKIDNLVNTNSTNLNLHSQISNIMCENSQEKMQHQDIEKLSTLENENWILKKTVTELRISNENKNDVITDLVRICEIKIPNFKLADFYDARRNGILNFNAYINSLGGPPGLYQKSNIVASPPITASNQIVEAMTPYVPTPVIVQNPIPSPMQVASTSIPSIPVTSNSDTSIKRTVSFSMPSSSNLAVPSTSNYKPPAALPNLFVRTSSPAVNAAQQPVINNQNQDEVPANAGENNAIQRRPPQPQMPYEEQQRLREIVNNMDYSFMNPFRPAFLRAKEFILGHFGRDHVMFSNKCLCIGDSYMSRINYVNLIREIKHRFEDCPYYRTEMSVTTMYQLLNQFQQLPRNILLSCGGASTHDNIEDSETQVNSMIDRMKQILDHMQYAGVRKVLLLPQPIFENAPEVRTRFNMEMSNMCRNRRQTRMSVRFLSEFLDYEAQEFIAPDGSGKKGISTTNQVGKEMTRHLHRITQELLEN